MNSFLSIKESVKDILYKDKGSKFIGYAFCVNDTNEIKSIIDALRKEHFSATHCCYAWRLGYGENEKIRLNDDGEPSGTAGHPIYNQILSFSLTNVLVVVVRYFGGTKLGICGLIDAYKESAKITLEKCSIVEHKITKKFVIIGVYEDYGAMQKIIKDLKIVIIKEEMNEGFIITLRVPKEYEAIFMSKLTHRMIISDIL